MMYLTKQERSVLLSIITVWCIGTSVQYAFKKNPRLHDSINVLNSAVLYKKVDINACGTTDLLAVPGIGPVIAERIITYRQERGPFKRIEEIQVIPGIHAHHFARIKDYLIVR